MFPYQTSTQPITSTNSNPQTTPYSPPSSSSVFPSNTGYTTTVYSPVISTVGSSTLSTRIAVTLTGVSTPTTSNSTTPSPGGRKSTPVAAIAGGAAGGVVALIAIAYLIYRYCQTQPDPMIDWQPSGVNGASQHTTTPGLYDRPLDPYGQANPGAYPFGYNNSRPPGDGWYTGSGDPGPGAGPGVGAGVGATHVGGPQSVRNLSGSEAGQGFTEAPSPDSQPAGSTSPEGGSGPHGGGDRQSAEPSVPNIPEERWSAGETDLSGHESPTQHRFSLPMSVTRIGRDGQDAGVEGAQVYRGFPMV